MPIGVGIKNTDAEIRDGVWADSIKANGADIAAIKTEIDAVEAKLDSPDNFKADVSALATAAALAVVDNEIAAIEAKLDAPDTFKADVSTLATAAALAIVDGVVDAIKVQADKNKLFAESGTDTQLTIANGVNEIIIKTFDKATYGSGEIKAFKVDLDKAASGFQTLAAVASTIKLRVYEKIDGTNYRLRTDDGASYTWTQGTTTDKVAEIDEISFSEDMQIRAVLSGAPTGTINLPWLCELNKNMEV